LRTVVSVASSKEDNSSLPTLDIWLFVIWVRIYFLEYWFYSLILYTQELKKYGTGRNLIIVKEEILENQVELS
jgi:hypothetical protein